MHIKPSDLRLFETFVVDIITTFSYYRVARKIFIGKWFEILEGNLSPVSFMLSHDTTFLSVLGNGLVLCVGAV